MGSLLLVLINFGGEVGGVGGAYLNLTGSGRDVGWGWAFSRGWVLINVLPLG